LPVEGLSPLHREALTRFLLKAFHLPPAAPFVDPALLDWKYDQPRPDWEGSRSFAWMDGTEIAAHACLCPVTYHAGGQEIAASYLIDWAAGRRPPGAGTLLLRKMASFFQVLLAIGGSADTRQILPKLGYKIAGELEFFVRVLRPWKQFRYDPARRGWKGPLRLARNTIWAGAPAPEVPSGWSCAAISRFDASHESLLGAETAFPATVRIPALMNYFLACPAARMSAFVIRHGEASRGWFVLSRVGGVLRIADLRIASANQEHWKAGYAVATRAASEDLEGCELVAAASTPLGAEALRSAGFRHHHADPIFALDPKELLIPHAPFDVSFIESDLAYLYTLEYPYLT
jgi:hypothetical protein